MSVMLKRSRASDTCIVTCQPINIFCHYIPYVVVNNTILRKKITERIFYINFLVGLSGKWKRQLGLPKYGECRRNIFRVPRRFVWKIKQKKIQNIERHYNKQLPWILSALYFFINEPFSKISFSTFSHFFHRNTPLYSLKYHQTTYNISEKLSLLQSLSKIFTLKVTCHVTQNKNTLVRSRLWIFVNDTLKKKIIKSIKISFFSKHMHSASDLPAGILWSMFRKPRKLPLNQ